MHLRNWTGYINKQVEILTTLCDHHLVRLIYINISSVLYDCACFYMYLDHNPHYFIQN